MYIHTYVCTYIRMYVHTVPALGESQLTFTLVAVIVKVKPLGGFGGPAAKKSEESPCLHCTSWCSQSSAAY